MPEAGDRNVRTPPHLSPSAIQLRRALTPRTLFSPIRPIWLSRLDKLHVGELLEISSALELDDYLIPLLVRYQIPVCAAHIDGVSRNRSTAQAMFDVWATLTDGLYRSGIEALTIKGIEIARHYPPDILRQRVDLDYLIPESQLDDFHAFLSSTGYIHGALVDGEIIPYDDDWLELRRRHMIHSGHWYKQLDGGVHIQVEPHFRLASPHEPVSFDCASKVAYSTQCHGVAYSTLSPHVHLAFLCVHIHRHDTFLGSIRKRHDGWIGFYIDALVYIRANYQRIDWNRLEMEARNRGWWGPIMYVLETLRQIFPWDETILPDDCFVAETCVERSWLTDIRYPAVTGNYRPVGSWSREPVERLFDMYRWRELTRIDRDWQERQHQLIDNRFANYIP